MDGLKRFGRLLRACDRQRHSRSSAPKHARCVSLHAAIGRRQQQGHWWPFLGNPLRLVLVLLRNSCGELLQNGRLDIFRERRREDLVRQPVCGRRPYMGHHQSDCTPTVKLSCPALDSQPATNTSASLQLTSVTGLMIHFNGTIMLRVPIWASKVDIMINAKPFTGERHQETLPLSPKNGLLEQKLTFVFYPKIYLNQILDDRPQYSSLYAIMYGPLLLVGMTTGERDLEVDMTQNVSTWVKPVDHQSELNSFQVFDQPNLYLRHSGFIAWANPINTSIGTEGQIRRSSSRRN